MKNVSFASLAYDNKKKKTRREKFLDEMDKVIPWECTTLGFGMTKIEQILGEGPALAESQKCVLEVMEKHSDHLWRMHDDDLVQLQAWATEPNLPEPPKGVSTASLYYYSLGTLRWAISTLFHRGKIGSIEIDRRNYYGSHKAIEVATKALREKNPTLDDQLKHRVVREKYIRVTSPQIRPK
jgi:hypothetical protein